MSRWFLSAGQRAQKQQEKLPKCVTPNNLHNLFSMSRSGVCGSFTSGREPTLTHLNIPEKYVKLELRREEEGGSLTCKYEEIDLEKCDGPGGFDECVSVCGRGEGEVSHSVSVTALDPVTLHSQMSVLLCGDDGRCVYVTADRSPRI